MRDQIVPAIILFILLGLVSFVIIKELINPSHRKDSQDKNEQLHSWRETEEKQAVDKFLKALAEVRETHHDGTVNLCFGSYDVRDITCLTNSHDDKMPVCQTCRAMGDILQKYKLRSL
jgi:hypothetical protein